MAELRRFGGGLIITTAAMSVALALAASAAPPITAVIAPASALQPADRLTPPGPSLGGCPVFPSSNAWNTDVSGYPLHPRSAQIIATIQSVGGDDLHPDFGSNPAYGIPYVVVSEAQPVVPITYTAYGDESDPGPFPVPLNAPVEGGGGSTGDRHVLVMRQGTCELFELYVARRTGAGWSADSGARWDLTTGALRPIGWTSADAAGLPILPGLVRYDEVASGVVRHAIRVTFAQTQRGFILPATHFASSRTNPDLPPMGMRLRLSATFDVNQLTGQARVIASAMQTYGLIVADNGSNWFFQGAPDPAWDDDDLSQLKAIPGTAFEVVDTGPVRTD
ncbi:MAG: hypothetical protein FD127_2780 [Acidimicrobiaceae bacterium]|nr:MAG: hypothetical protein FD127_2780 [Acidimicrobiaceae bacterium]